MTSENSILTAKNIQNRIFTIRGVQVILDSDLAEMYQVETRVLNQAVKRNSDRFPIDFMFQLSKEEFENILISQFVISSSEHGGRRKLHRGLTVTCSEIGNKNIPLTECV